MENKNEMAGYTPLFNSIVTSSIWNEDNETRIVWITLLALADAEGKVEGSVSGLAPVARLSIEAVEKALERLKSPDKYSRTKDFEGRRIADIEGGWQVINHHKFRELAKSRAAYHRNWREKRKITPIDNSANSNTNPNSDTERNTAQQSATSYTVDFEEFWSIYPKKVGKGEAFRSWRKLDPDLALRNKIKLALGCQKTSKDWTKEGGQYIPNPATWLNQRRFDDTGIVIPDNKPDWTCKRCGQKTALLMKGLCPKCSMK